MVQVDFAIGVLSYNHPDITAQCLRSVQKFLPDQFIYLMHNGSLKSHVNKLRDLFPAISHIHITENKGFTGGANELLSSIFKDFNQVLFLTNDTELLKLPAKCPSALSAVKIMKRNTDQVDSIFGELNLYTGRLKHLRNFDSHFNLTQANPTVRYYIPGTAFWISKEVFIALEGFDESFHTYWEDVDLSLRAQAMGLKLELSPDTVIKHKIGKTCHKNRFYTYDLFQRNRALCFKKNNLLNLRFYFHYIIDVVKYSKKDYKKMFNLIFKVLL